MICGHRGDLQAGMPCLGVGSWVSGAGPQGLVGVMTYPMHPALTEKPYVGDSEATPEPKASNRNPAACLCKP